MAMIDNFVMEAVDEYLEMASILVDIALADELEGYIVMIDNFVMEAVDEEQPWDKLPHKTQAISKIATSRTPINIDILAQLS
ncbi:hypothetical protein EDD18DRAFT_1347221 [Armillaria luteobubalina]|uniref:Uncharacterized protein n=1 Tax=Armillaria luteobubalina TaxID=153913 RepID=A0AA39QHX2_9AGAR|nr:hypothetical protein EDD18DRAFT_1347221 [Armillaria luteobubalina]